MAAQLFVHVLWAGSGPMIWRELVEDFERSGIDNNVENIYVSLVIDPFQEKEFLQTLCNHPKIRVITQSDDPSVYEWPALKMMKDHCSTHPGDFVGYIHTKGASNEGRKDVPARISENIRKWRRAMVRDVIYGVDMCHHFLRKGFATAGPFLGLYDKDVRHVYMYSGNAWWAHASYINTLEITSEDLSMRNRAEEWVCRGADNRHASTTPLPQLDLYDFSGVYGERGPLGDIT